MSDRWIWFIALRYIFRGRKKSPSPVLSVLGIAVGVFALIVIIAVMNGFQLGFIESILEISSYHARIGSLDSDTMKVVQRDILAVNGIESAVPFLEFQALLRGNRGGQQTAIIRGFPVNAPVLDAGMSERLAFEEGSFDIEGEYSVLLGAELARRLGVGSGDEITLFSIPALFGLGESDEQGETRTFTVKGIFRTGFYEYDVSWAFVNIDDAAAFADTGPVLGLKLKNRFQDHRVIELIRENFDDLSGFENAELSGWRDYNRSFFGALRTEKLFMFILVGLIFIVVALNIYQAQRRAVLEHREEIGLLRAVGGGARSVRLIFVCDGAIIGFTGAAAGLILGILTASHISGFFTIMENIVNFFINIINIVKGFFAVGDVDDFSFFSPAVFYIKEIPSRLIPQEAFMIFMFGFLSALLAAYFASRRVSRIRVAEVLRGE